MEHLEKMRQRLTTINIIIAGICVKAFAEDRRLTDREWAEIGTLNDEYVRVLRMQGVLEGLGI